MIRLKTHDSGVRENTLDRRYRLTAIASDVEAGSFSRHTQERQRPKVIFMDVVETASQQKRISLLRVI
jgi:hypothetical protein